jgi:hypothetical protein
MCFIILANNDIFHTSKKVFLRNVSTHYLRVLVIFFLVPALLVLKTVGISTVLNELADFEI